MCGFRPARRIRWVRHGTGAARISRCFPPMPRRSSCACSTASGRREIERIALPERTEDVWHGYLNDVAPGQLYGYRVHGPYEPERGFRFNPHKLLIDPYAKQLAGRLVWSDAHFGYRAGSAAGRSVFRSTGQRARNAEGRRHRRSFHLGGGAQAIGSLGRHHHLRSARQGTDAAARRRPAGLARHLPRSRGAGRHRSSSSGLA